MGDILEIEISPRSLPFNKFELVKVDNPTKQQKELYENWLYCSWEDK